jgi:hypothetical protein
MYVCMYVHMHACMYVCIYVRTYVCMYVHMRACMYVCIYVCTYVCMYVCMCAQYTEPKCPIITNCNMKATKTVCMYTILQLLSLTTHDILHTACTNPMKE